MVTSRIRTSFSVALGRAWSLALADIIVITIGVNKHL
jgi:hypothetical protein